MRQRRSSRKYCHGDQQGRQNPSPLQEFSQSIDVHKCSSLSEQPMGFARPQRIFPAQLPSTTSSSPNLRMGCLANDIRAYSRSGNLCSVGTHAGELSCSGESSSGCRNFGGRVSLEQVSDRRFPRVPAARRQAAKLVIRSQSAKRKRQIFQA